MSEGSMVADVIAAIASIDPVMGGVDRLSAASTRSVLARLEVDAKEIIARYPRAARRCCRCCTSCSRRRATSARDGIEFCAELLDLTTAEVAAVATFYTMYKRRPNGDYTVGVCTNTLCAVMGGDQIFAHAQGAPRRRPRRDDRRRHGHPRAPRVQRGLRLRAGDDGQLGVLRQPDARSPRSQLVDDLRAGDDGRRPTRGASLCTFKQVSRVLAGFPDGRADEGPAAGRRPWLGLEIYREQQNAADGAGRRDAEKPAPRSAPRRRRPRQDTGATDEQCPRRAAGDRRVRRRQRHARGQRGPGGRRAE